MTPQELAGWLRRIQAGLGQVPGDLERIATSEAARVVPPQAGVSVLVSRSSSGVRVLLSGRGARRAGARLGPVLSERGREAVRARVRGAR